MCPRCRRWRRWVRNGLKRGEGRADFTPACGGGKAHLGFSVPGRARPSDHREPSEETSPDLQVVHSSDGSALDGRGLSSCIGNNNADGEGELKAPLPAALTPGSSCACVGTGAAAGRAVELTGTPSSPRSAKLVLFSSLRTAGAADHGRMVAAAERCCARSLLSLLRESDLTGRRDCCTACRSWS